MFSQVQVLININKGFTRFITKLYPISLVLLSTAFVLFNLICQFMILYLLPTNIEHHAAKDPLWKQIAFVLIAGPIIETLIFQVLLIRWVRNQVSQLEVVATLISAIFFGLWHSTNVTFMAAGFVFGITLATFYFVLRLKSLSPFLYLTIMHSGFNLVALIINDFLP
ncbi:MAG: CPBP family intramembrane metalloprotease [Chitinophagaceae bacterium]|nr:MAG: CPBP family intramembrane metalloprotease [Chitinophagaceae bacterium]